MALDSFIDKIPESDREAFKAEIANVISVMDKDQAFKLLEDNPNLRAARNSYESRAVASFEKRFMEEKLGPLIEAKYKEKHPDADPKDLAYKELESRLNAIQKESLLKERKTVALQKFSELGLPINLADLAIDDDETKFNSKLEIMATLKDWRDSEVTRILNEKLGNQGNPKGGNTGTMDFSKMSQTEVMAYARKGSAEEKAVTDWLAKRK